MTDTPATPAIPLAARINGARPWIPSKNRTGDENLEGYLVTVLRRENNQGEPYPVLILDSRREDGLLTAWHAQGELAQEQLRKAKPGQGELVGICAHVPTESKTRKEPNGNPVKYTAYTVYDPTKADVAPTPEMSWDDLAVGDDEPRF